MPRIKLAVAVLLSALALAACSQNKGGGGGGSATALPDDMSLGNPKAKVTVVEYASVGCPVCDKWQLEVWPAFRAKYVDTGRVHYVFREMLVGGGPEVTVAASGFLLARCAGRDKYFPVIDAIFKNQQEAFADPRGTLETIAKSMGMSEAQFNQCVGDDKAIQALNDRTEKNAKDNHVDSTPTFVVNGKMLTPGYHSLPELDAAIAEAGG
ncbi:MAG TPA: DsbA family protein [Phenylobacterium sp.]|uniref:DsbA family protein n=1 Tax=Phenylobacterium sp. TaxID=1871053 RepID=UPI002BD3007F|nr:DsbA family protein [Phenylobacterium sp.]HSV03769.1 DsbA family protein [Phenylobacterium sp.]